MGSSNCAELSCNTDKLLPGKYYFSSYTIQKYKSRSADYTGLISFLAAAKTLNLYPDNFYNKYIKTGRLKPVLAGGRRCEHFFRLKDVEALLKIERQTIITPEAAKILEVNVSCINKMIASRVLHPISGPGIDGFGKNLFLRRDVEKLYAERGLQSKEHKEGKTSRFGRESRSIEPRRKMSLSNTRYNARGKILKFA